jgi:hypothetical protein
MSLKAIAAPAKETARHQPREEKAGHLAARKDARHLDAGQFPSRWPDAPEPVAGVARTLSRGMP